MSDEPSALVPAVPVERKPRSIARRKDAEPDLLKARARAWLRQHADEILDEGKRLMLEGTRDDDVRFKAWKTLVDKFLPDLKEKVSEQSTGRPIAIQINNVQRGKPQHVKTTARIIETTEDLEAEAS